MQGIPGCPPQESSGNLKKLLVPGPTSALVRQKPWGWGLSGGLEAPQASPEVSQVVQW